MIRVEQLKSVYHAGTPYEFEAIKNVTTTFEANKYYAIVGHTGSGKSTLVQHLNGLLTPTEGVVSIKNLKIKPKTKHRVLHKVKQSVGMVFQFPENQLFEETVIKDVMFGPKNMGATLEEAYEKAAYYLQALNIDESYFDRSPFELSGGQMRKVAISGILAMEPEVLIVDEPTAGLDPMSHIETMNLFKKLQQEHHFTLILVTHNMDDVFTYADEVKILNQGELVTEGRVEDIFTNRALLNQYNLEVPKLVQLVDDLNARGHQFTTYPKTIDAFISMYKGDYYAQ